MSIRILILKDGVITPTKSSSDKSAVINNLGVVDLNTNQTIGGTKTFTSSIYSQQLLGGYFNSTSNIGTVDADLIPVIFGKTFNWVGADWTPTTSSGSSISCLGMDFTTNGAVDLPTGGSYAGFFRYRHLGTSTIATAQGIRLVALNVSTGNITNFAGAFFTARNDSTGTVTNLIGGEFVSTSGSTGVSTNLVGGKFTATVTNASATTSTLIGGQFIVGSNNTTPATSAIGIDIANITGTAITKIPLRVGTGGSSFFNDTTASTSTTTGAVIVVGGVGVSGTVNANIFNAVTQINVAGTKVLGVRDTGWTAPTGTANKGAFASDTATLLETARRVFSLETALRNHGIIGS